MQITEYFISMLSYIADRVSLPLFTVIGSFIEEVIAPIPSPLVMTLAGSLSASEGNPWTYLLWLALIGAMSKTVGSWVVYVAADRAEDVIIDKFGRFLGVSHKDTEGIGKYLNKGRRDDVVLFLLRAIPIVPTAPVSIVCGLIKLNIRTYLIATFLGTIVRNMLYLYLGYTSVGTLESLNEGFDSWETWGYVFLFVSLVALVGWMHQKRRSGHAMRFFDRFQK